MGRITDLLVRIRALQQNPDIYNHISDGMRPGEYSHNIVENLIYYFNDKSTNLQHLLNDLEIYIHYLEMRQGLMSDEKPQKGG